MYQVYSPTLFPNTQRVYSIISDFRNFEEPIGT